MTKAISERRDRRQSAALVGLVGLLLLAETAAALRLALPELRTFPAHVAGAIAISVLFAMAVRLARAATTPAAICGGMICLVLTSRTGWLAEPVWRSALTPLACLFALTFAATRAGGERKRRAGLAEDRRGRRTSQVVANLSAAALSVSPAAEWLLRHGLIPGVAGFTTIWVPDIWVPAAMKAACLAALIEATSDTLSSELGQAFGGRPVLLAGCRRVDPGTDGAVSLLGTAAGIAGGVVVAATGGWAMHLGGHATGVALECGVMGVFADSVLGATVERRGWIGNDLVNFLSTAIAAMLAGLLLRP